MTAADAQDADDWHEANRRYLVARLAALGCLLSPGSGGEDEARRAIAEAAAALRAPAAIDRVAALFDLSPFERDLLLLCAGVELDASFAARCAAAQGDPLRVAPTFSLALAALPGAHWGALGPGAPLRRMQLIEVGQGETLTLSPLRICERVLHFIAGVEHPDERLAGLVAPAAPVAAPLAPSQARLAARIGEALRAAAGSGGARPTVGLTGADPASRRAVAAAACASVGLGLLALSADALATRQDAQLVGRLLGREAALSSSALLVEADDLDATDAARAGLVGRLLDGLPGPVLVSARERLRLGRRPDATFEVSRPAAQEQAALWRQALPAAQGGLIDRLVAQFDLDEPALRRAAAAAASAGDGADPDAALWDACRAEARPALDELTQRIEPAATWDDLVLPEAARASLREIAASHRQRGTVHGAFGFAERGARGLGAGALFAGPSGTGKTMAAEVLAAELRLDLHRVDLSQLVSRYIGETEKNLRRVFDAAERGAAILLFDEADALFGRRGEVRDTVDRYANMEVAYLLQRIEAYRGLSILTTNLERNLDPAFLRRLRFVVRFPLPGPAERAALWRRAFPPRAPVVRLDVERLAQMSLTGGSVRNVALRAAFLAAEAGTPIRMDHVLAAARAEYEKLGRGEVRAEGG
ncbi:ATP-binding protein [Sorangium sp. So ce426]|uniref:ATP-binding protein n=1 Tax=Sorangium sp. So ce426 TaxID=3133312 RepID=UPI003F5C72F2